MAPGGYKMSHSWSFLVAPRVLRQRKYLSTDTGNFGRVFQA